MPTTVNEAFASCLSNLEVPDVPAERLSARQDKICEVLQQKVMILNDFVAGSYTRSTMIGPLKEATIDHFVVLESHYYYHFNEKRRCHLNLLGMIHWALRQTYKRPAFNRNGRAVTVWFSDFGVNVVPVILCLGDGYLIPDARTKRWISTNPRKHDEILGEANQAHRQLLVPLIKMIKAWNRCNGSFFTSFHIEVLALEVFSRATIVDLPSGILLFFDRARDAVARAAADPAGFGNDIGDYLRSPAKIAEAQRRLGAAYKAALRAEQQDPTRERTAVDLWRQLFPRYFPA